MSSPLEIKMELSKRLKPVETYVPCGGDAEWYQNSIRRRDRARNNFHFFLQLAVQSVIEAGITVDQLDELIEEYNKQRELIKLRRFVTSELRPLYFEQQDEELAAREMRNEKAMMFAIIEITKRSKNAK